jgi:hypothetical protein
MAGRGINLITVTELFRPRPGNRFATIYISIRGDGIRDLTDGF